MARAMWKGSLALGEHAINVKMYSAVEDRSIRFHMLHRKDHAPVEQHIIRKDTGKDVARDDIRKAFAVDGRTAVILRPQDLEELSPAESRDIHLSRFVAADVLSDQWYDRPYYLGPDADEDAYFALAQALEDKQVIGVARWTMRRKQYIGALTTIDGYLALCTLRRADQVLKFSGIVPAKGAAPLANELKLAQQLLTSIEANFDPQQWQNDYRQRLQGLIAAKARGRKLMTVRAPKKVPQASLAASLKASITAAARQKKVA